MSDLANPILQWLNANPNWSGFITFLISATESIAVIGTIIPGSVMMTAIGTLAGAGIIPLWHTVFWAILGAVVGDGVSYWIGYRFKDRLHNIWPFRTHPQMLIKGEGFFTKYGAMSVFIGRFVGPVRALVPLVAGMFGVKPLRFTIANILSAIGWAPAYMLPGIVLGAASLELPPDVTTHAFVTLLLLALFIILCIWIVWKLFLLVHNQINHFLNRIWASLERSRYFHVVTLLLKHHNSSKTHGQLILAFYFVMALSLFLSLMMYLTLVHPQQILVNKVFFHFARSLHTPTLDHIMLNISLIGDMFTHTPTLLLLTGVVCVWLVLAKRWFMAIHALLLIVLTVASVEVAKHFAQSPRPWGIAQSPSGFSFPSGHTVLSTVFWFGLALLIIKVWRLKRKWPLFTLMGILVAFISLSRVYLGAHWFTDIVGAWLLSIALLMLVALSYNRQKKEPPIYKGYFLLALTVALTVSYSYTNYAHHNQMQKNYAQVNWPTTSLTLLTWWEHNDKLFPLHRLNRFGFEQDVFNLQWLGPIDEIRTLLLKNGWEVPPQRDWASILQRVTDVNSAEHLPLVSALYLDKKPVLVLTKRINSDKKLLVLRLWQSAITIKNNPNILWVGSVEMIPRTYSWLFKKTKARKVALAETVLFNEKPPQLLIKPLGVKSKRMRDYSILLIRSRSAHP